MKRLLTAAGLLTLVLAGAASSGHARAAGTVSSSRLVDGGNIRITVTVRTPVQVGSPLDVRFRVQNVSAANQTIQLDGNLWFAVRNAFGERFDTRVAYRGISGVAAPTTLRPGAGVTRQVGQQRVQWSGPLRITPGWDNDRLASLRVNVESPGAPGNRAAVAEVVASAGHLLDRCRPVTPGVAVIGEIHGPPHGPPPLHARCSVSLLKEPGFVVAQVLAASPSSFHVHWDRKDEQFAVMRIRHGVNVTAIAWRFVVTKDGATSVNSASFWATRPRHRMAPNWRWTSSGYQGHPGRDRCGSGTGASTGGYLGPEVEFVSVCR